MSNPVYNDWRQHEYTRKLKAEAEKLLEVKLMNLLSTCATSTDPKVTQKLAEYRGHETFVKLLKGDPNERTGGLGHGADSDSGERD